MRKPRVYDEGPTQRALGAQTAEPLSPVRVRPMTAEERAAFDARPMPQGGSLSCYRPAAFEGKRGAR